MKQVAKLVIVDNDDKYLMMYRSNHPTFGDDPDLPGGLVEVDESPLGAMMREVQEEAGIEIVETEVQELYEGTDYSAHHTDYALYIAKLDTRPTVTMSWEHAAYEWLSREEFLHKAKSANDTYMHMVYNRLTE